MSFTEKQKYDLNNMNTAAQSVRLGDYLEEINSGDGSSGSIKVDATLENSGEAADAKVVGDKFDEINGKLTDASSSKSGLMSATDKEKLDGFTKGTNVPKAASSTVTKEEFDALIDSLVNGGFIAGA